MNSGHGTPMAEAREMLLYASATVNACILLYFTVFICIDKVAICILSRSSLQRLRSLHSCHQAEARRFYLDSLFQVSLPFVGFYLLFSTDVINNPFQGPTDQKAQVVFSVMLGFYLFRNFRELFTFGKTPHFKSTIVHHVVAVVTYSVLVDSKENAIYGVIGTILEGGNVFIGLCKYLKMLELRDTSFYNFNKFLGLIFSVMFRGVVPVVVMALSISAQRPLSMGYVSVTVFFLAGFYFGVINFYIIESVAESAFRQWFCDSRVRQGPITPPSNQIWQRRRFPDLERSDPSVPYTVTQSNIYVTTPPQLENTNDSLLPTTINDVKEKLPEDASESVRRYSTDSAVSLNMVTELKSESDETRQKITVCPNYGTCNSGNARTIDMSRLCSSDNNSANFDDSSSNAEPKPPENK
ncbi:uncharacterized protein [Ptychodera flava]|uniref:uncharacterized protein n=1 Tax=Ptychodera flava TaxID=63121 RepID=UPI00396A2B67